MIIQAYKNFTTEPNEERKMPDYPDIIILKPEKITKRENGKLITETKYKKVNVTKKVKEQEKLLKAQSAEEKIAEIEKIFTK